MNLGFYQEYDKRKHKDLSKIIRIIIHGKGIFHEENTALSG